MDYPVQLDVTSPPRFDRIQLVLRLALAIALGWLGITAGWLMCVVFLTLPIVAAIVVSTHGARVYVDDTGPKLWRAIGWLLALSAYMLLLVDRFPLGETGNVRIELRLTGQPTTSSAMLRLIMSIPSGFVLGLLGIVSSVMFVVGVVTILIDETVPAGIVAFQRGVLRWQARLLAYHASLVDEYPPFSFEEPHTRPGDRASMV
jgi:hypothetical protein